MVESKKVASGINCSTQTYRRKDTMLYKMSNNENKHQNSIDEERWQLGRDEHVRMMVAAEKMGYKV